MGGQPSTLDKTLKEYEDLTYLNFKQIQHCYKRFRDIKEGHGQIIREDESDLTNMVRTYEEVFEGLPELKENPFRKRICDVFSVTEGDNLNFLEFLDICSVFHEDAPIEAKINRAFQIFDWDGDEYIGRDDIEKVIQIIAPPEKPLNVQTDATAAPEKSSREKVDTAAVANEIFNETNCDPKGLRKFHMQEILEKSPDFSNNFSFSLQ